MTAMLALTLHLSTKTRQQLGFFEVDVAMAVTLKEYMRVGSTCAFQEERRSASLVSTTLSNASL